MIRQQRWEDESELLASLETSGIPAHMYGGIIRFYFNGIEPGSFLSAVINNDLRMAFGCADATNRERIYDYLFWFYNEAPAGTWGYPGAVKRYCESFREENHATE